MDWIKSWLLAIVFRARMGATEAGLLVVTFGAIFLATLPLQPKPEETALLHLLWWAVVVGSGLLVARGAIALALATFRPVRLRLASLLDRLPFEFRSPVVRRRFLSLDQLSADTPLGFLDFEHLAVQGANHITRTLGELSKDTESVGKTMAKYSPRFVRARDQSTDARVNLSKEFARKLYPYARRMEANEKVFRADIEQMATNYLERFKTIDPDGLASLRPLFAGMREAVTESRASLSEYRGALASNRELGVQQQVNAVIDSLTASATEIVSDFDRTMRFTNDALRYIDERLAPAAPPARRAKRRPATPRP